MPEPSSPIKVLIVDDEALIRAGLRALLQAADGYAVVGEAASGVEAVRQSRRHAPDVVLMDIRMPIMDGLEATRVLAAEAHPPRVLIVTTFDDDEHVFEALRAGASGFIVKDTPPRRLLEAIRVVADGESLLDPNATRRLIGAFVGRARRDPVDTLTPRERDVLEQVALGRSNSEIAETLFLGVTTVKTHVGRILEKLGARDRVQLVVAAYEAGVVSVGRAARSP